MFHWLYHNVHGSQVDRISYTLSAKKKSSVRVALWRRLQRVGAISPVSGVYLLPAIDDCIESFQWLAQEVQQADGQVIVMHVDGFDGLDDQEIVELFQAARKDDYAELNQQALSIESFLKSDSSVEAIGQAQDELAKLKRRYAEIGNIDYFDSYERTTTAARLDKIGHILFPEATPAPKIPIVKIADYQRANMGYAPTAARRSAGLYLAHSALHR